MKMTFKLILLLLAVALPAACQPGYVPAPVTPLPPAEQPVEQPVAPAEPAPIVPIAPTLAGTSWVLSSLDGALPLPGTTVTLDFGANGSASGSDGCNQFSTTFIQEGESVRFSQPGASTMMACADAVMSQAAAFSAALAQTTAFTGSGRQLILRNGNTILATFVVASQDLAATSWQVTAYNNGRQAVVGVLDGSEVSLNFESDGTLNGNAGCNQFFGDFTAGGGSVSVGTLGATMRFCDSPPGVMQQEAEVMAALESAATFSISGDRLELRSAVDEIAIHATRALVVDMPTPAPAVPWGRVVAGTNVNVRSGPGTHFPIIGVARPGDEGAIVGRSVDNRWWATTVSAAPGGLGWISGDFVIASDADGVPVIEVAPPPIVVPPTVPAPPATATPLPPATATPGAQISFSAERTTINQGQCTALRWSVENVQAVWVYPQGERYYRFPRTGQGSEQVCPSNTSTWEMRVLQRDGAVVFRTVTVNVTPATPVPPAGDALNGTRWDVVAFNTGGAVVTPISGSHMTADFANGQVSGSAGCNNFTAGYSLNGNNISISPPSGGMMMCDTPAGVMEQEAQFRAALQSAATFRITGNTLELRNGSDQIAVTLNRAP